MKLRESESQNWRLLKDINELLVMDRKALIKHIEKNVGPKTNGEILLAIITALVFDIRNLFRKPIEPTSSKYPKLELNNSFAENYISDVKHVLCESNHLCKNADEISNFTIEEQVDYISNLILKQEVLGESRYRISLSAAVLILKIGITDFCGCADPTKPNKS